MQKLVLTRPIFKYFEHKKGENENTFSTSQNIDPRISLEKLSKIDKKILSQSFFELVRDEDALSLDMSHKKFVQIKATDINIRDEAMTMIQIIDFSTKILYDQQHAKAEFQAIINACVSHELRNPMNSIQA